MAAAPSIPRLLLDRLAQDAARELFFEKRDGRWVGTTGGRALAETRALAAALAALGIRKGDRVAIMGECCGRWSLLDLAVLAIGAVTVGVYTTSSAPQVGYLLGHSGARAIFLDRPEHRAKVEAVVASLKK